MAKARVAPATELLEDVVRGPLPASLEALPWWHLFALNHFLEGVQGRCLRWDPRQAVPLARCCRASGIAAPLYWEKDVKTSPPWGREACKRRFDSYSRENGIPEKACRARQGLGAHGKGILPGSSCHPPEARMGDARRKPSATGLHKASVPCQRR
jgi:hypothetical protein